MKFAAAAILIIVLVGMFWSLKSWGVWRGQRDDILTAVVSQGDLVITVTDRGELESAKSVEVRCDIEGGGKLVTIAAEGTRVEKDQEVARFDTDTLMKGINEQAVKWEQAEAKVKASLSELDVQKNKAESEIAKADLALTLAKIDFESYEEGEYQVELDKRQGALELAKKELKEAEDNLAFTQSLIKKGLAQLEQKRVMELNLEGKRFVARQQEADLKVLKMFTRKRKSTELKAKAEESARELERANKTQAAATEKAANEVVATQKTAELEKSQLERLRKQLDKCVVKAPQSGIVIYDNSRPWDPNSHVRPGATLYFQQPIFTLPDLDAMRVKMKVHESMVKKVLKGQTATLQIEALSGRILHGKVEMVASVSQNNEWRGGGVKEYVTHVSVDDLPKGEGLKPGMTAEVKILINTVHNCLTVPVQAVTELDGKHICYVVAGGRAKLREVTVGESNEQLIEVKEGLSKGERVALDARVRAAAELKKNGGDKKLPSDGKPETEKSQTGSALAKKL